MGILVPSTAWLVARVTWFVAPGGKGFGGKTLLTRYGHEMKSSTQTTRTMMLLRSMKRFSGGGLKARRRARDRNRSRPTDDNDKSAAARARNPATRRAL